MEEIDERVQQRTMEQIVGVPTPQAVEESVEMAVPQIPRTMEQVVVLLEGAVDMDTDMEQEIVDSMVARALWISTRQAA